MLLLLMLMYTHTQTNAYPFNSALKVMPGQNGCLHSFTPETVNHCLLKQSGRGLLWCGCLVLDAGLDNSFNYINNTHKDVALTVPSH